MGKRRQARELAMQFLYQMDLREEKDWADDLENFWREFELGPEIKDFALCLIDRVKEKQAEIDKLIAEYTTNWDISRIAAVDRNVLRVGICELVYMDDIPPVVSINEAVDIVKKYGSVESGKFINGILDKIRMESSKDDG